MPVLNKPRTRRTHTKVLGVRRVAEAIAKHGPISTVELAVMLRVGRPAVSTIIQRLRFGDVPYAPLRIARYRPPIGGGAHAPLYKFDIRMDAPLKVPTVAQRCRAYRQRKRQSVMALLDARERSLISGRPAGPFDQLLQLAV